MNLVRDKEKDDSLDQGAVLKDSYPEAIFQKREGSIFYRWCLFYGFLPLWFLLFVSVVWAFLPDSFFALDVIVQTDEWFRQHSEKLANEGADYDALSPMWGTRYVVFLALCWVFVALTNVILIVPTAMLAWRYGHPIAREQRNAIFKALLILLGVGSVVFYWEWMGTDDPSPGLYLKFITRTWLVYSLSAVMAAFGHLGIAAIVIYITKFIKHRSI